MLRTCAPPIARELARFVSPDTLDFWLRRVDPVLAVRRIHAEITGLRFETPRARTVILRPNGNWPGFRAGQHVLLTVEVEGRRLTRAFSLSGAEGEPTLRLTVGRRPNGRVSRWVHERAQAGAVVELSTPRGDFVLPADASAPILLIAGGTGATPFLSMLRSLAARSEARDVVLLCYVPQVADLIAAHELQALPERVAGLRVHVVCTRERDGAVPNGHFSPAQLHALVPDFAARLTYVCGPAGLMDAVTAQWTQRGLTDRLRREWFTVPLRPPGGGSVRVHCTRTGAQVELAGVASLLEELEGAGLRPRHGCRAGICRECMCVKVSGTVEDLRTGQTEAGLDEPIQLCVSRARGDVALAL